MTSLPEDVNLITRRNAIARVSAMLGGIALVGGSSLLTGCASTSALRGTGSFTQTDIEFLDEVADTILPETDTPGAKTAGVGSFMAAMATDAYDANEQSVFRDGMQTLNMECEQAHGSAFMAASATQRLSLLERLDREQYDYINTRQPGSPTHYFRMMKELALLGYFTSEIGYTQAMRYTETPGRFEPCVPYSRGDKSWAPHA